MKRIALIGLLSAALAGCSAELYTPVEGPVAATPDLVAVAPGVQVIADYDQPIFYAEGFYWWSLDGVWYRSASYTDGWVLAPPPIVITNIITPWRYTHYHPHGYVVRHPPVPSHRIVRPRVRDHRTH